MPAPLSLELFALPAFARALTALLRGGSRLALVLLLVALVRANDPPLTPLALAEALGLFAAAPELAARLVLRAYAARAQIEGSALVIVRADRIARVPLAAITAIAPSLLPLPLPALALSLRSGATFSMRLALADPRPLLLALRDAGCAPANSALETAPLRYAAARTAFGRPWWLRWPARIAAFALLPGLVGLSAHQHIAFGAFFGEYYLMGLRAWLLSAAAHYATAAMYLALWSALWRVPVEGAAWLGARSTERNALASRALGEHIASAIYFASVPTLLALRFLA